MRFEEELMPHKTIVPVIALSLLLSMGFVGSSAQELGDAEHTAKSHPSVGDLAPDFTLHDQDDKPIALHDFRGKSVVLVFYVFSFSPLANREISELSSEAEKWGGKAQVLAISVDSIAVNHAFADAKSVKFPLLSDREMKVGSIYGIYSPTSGIMPTAYERALASWIIDSSGRIVSEQKGETALNLTSVSERLKGAPPAK
jgi:peroxiredoxin